MEGTLLPRSVRKFENKCLRTQNKNETSQNTVYFILSHQNPSQLQPKIGNLLNKTDERLPRHVPGDQVPDAPAERPRGLRHHVHGVHDGVEEAGGRVQPEEEQGEPRRRVGEDVDETHREEEVDVLHVV